MGCNILDWLRCKSCEYWGKRKERTGPHRSIQKVVRWICAWMDRHGSASLRSGSPTNSSQSDTLQVKSPILAKYTKWWYILGSPNLLIIKHHFFNQASCSWKKLDFWCTITRLAYWDNFGCALRVFWPDDYPHHLLWLTPTNSSQSDSRQAKPHFLAKLAD